jgi:hypothetical protein
VAGVPVLRGRSLVGLPLVGKVGWSGFFVVEVKLLFAGYRLTVFGCGMEGPLLDGCDDVLVDAVAQAAGHLDVGDLAGRVDHDVEDDIAFCAAGEGREVRLGWWEVAG